MSYELRKPINDKERADFIITYNHNLGLKIEDTEMFLFALEENEIMGEKEIEITVTDYDEEGNPTGEHTETIIIPYPVIDSDYEEKQTQKRRDKFNREFFSTSLGYIRRSVTMSDGNKKDFLSDMLPIISIAAGQQQPVTVLTYDEPDFAQDVEDWTVYQHEKLVTLEFVQECFMQLQSDFVG